VSHHQSLRGKKKKKKKRVKDDHNLFPKSIMNRYIERPSIDVVVGGDSASPTCGRRTVRQPESNVTTRRPFIFASWERARK
jgi:hypothetical protein